jgi:uncharacterized protein (TIGR02444 family)
MQHEAFWDFSNRIYQQPEVRDLCLQLQNEHGMDVNLLLFACWHARSRGLLARRTAKDALSFSLLWSAQVIQPLRQARTWMKHNTAPACTADARWLTPGYEQLREQIKALELECEHFQENRLEDMVQSPPLEQAMERQIAAAVFNLRYFIEETDLTQNAGMTDKLAALIVNALVPIQEQDLLLHKTIVSGLQH